MKLLTVIKRKQLISQVGLGNYQLDAQIEHMSGESNNVLPSLDNSCMNLKFYYWTKLLALLDTHNKRKWKKLYLN